MESIASEQPLYSVVIPVFNSGPIVAQTIERTIGFFEQQGWPYELILVNDGSTDESWTILDQTASSHPNVIAINLIRNYGQHTAVYCGFEHCRGDFVITLDDDLQNPPEEIAHLVRKAMEGYDVVFGRFREKKHSLARRMGSQAVQFINRRVFNTPPGLMLTNFRILRREVVERICGYRTNAPYINGLAVMFAANPTNVRLEHNEREHGASQYTPLRIVKLMMRILFNYSAWPLRFVSGIGLTVAILSFVIGAYFLSLRLFDRVQVPGWTTVVVLLSFFNGLSLLILGMLGEYIVRLLNEIGNQHVYYIKETVRQGA